MDNKTIENNFTYQKPNNLQQEKYVNLRELGKDMARLIESTVPVSREKSLAFTKLEEAIFWANAGIARN